LTYLLLDSLTDPLVDFSSLVDVAATTLFESNSKRPHFKAYIVDDLLGHNFKRAIEIINKIA